jgi:hypothetical protein
MLIRHLYPLAVDPEREGRAAKAKNEKCQCLLQ